jgi:manganese oxidase
MKRTALSFCGVTVWLLLIFAFFGPLAYGQCERQIRAEVVALDQPFWYNRLGAFNPAGMIYALRQDVVSTNGSASLSAGQVALRADKRPRPLVLRMNEGDCLDITFTNLLNPTRVDNDQPATRTASVHVMGLQVVDGISSDGSNVGNNPSSLAAPGETKVYKIYGHKEGTYLLYSTAATTGGEGNGGSLAMGLFGAVNVEPRGARWYRSQVTEDDLYWAAKTAPGGEEPEESEEILMTSQGHPLLDYEALYPAGHPFAGTPILNMLHNNEIVHSDLNAIITGPGGGRFPNGTYSYNPAYPDRDRPFREFTVIFHDEAETVQAFPEFEDPVLEHTLHGVRDTFPINYGAAGAGAEILANRKGLGPMQKCVDCKYEEFFLTSWAVGDPAMVVNIPANMPKNNQDVFALYPDDPSNVHHSYLNDPVKFRNLHAGPAEHHIFHLHAHQWLFNYDNPSSTYLDSQAIGPGSAFTYEIAYNGSGNRNKTPGDSIFHCHFYPHFAQGMWGLWRVHDVFEDGSRRLPDGEIAAGTPIPAVVPIPTLPMAPMPGARVSIVPVEGLPGGQILVEPWDSETEELGNPGFPFYIPGIAGHRPPRPPMDVVWDGGLPRRLVLGGTATSTQTRLDFTKLLQTVEAVEIPEEGTGLEVLAMEFHARRAHDTFLPDGTEALEGFRTNGRAPVAGAPFADPCVSDDGYSYKGNPRVYKGAAIQLEVVFNKAGWHFPQQRIMTLWGDVKPTLDQVRPPEPLFMRVHSGDCITYHHTNLTPHEYLQDDFQVRTPTDILGQHIHLVKFDVLASDGAANGFNYEDGTLAPGEVREQIQAINQAGGLLRLDGSRETLAPKAHPFFGQGVAPGLDGKPEWLGAQTTIQRWYADPLVSRSGEDRTLRTVFTHDHYAPSTIQHPGLYAGLVIEPSGSTWRDPETGATMGNRTITSPYTGTTDKDGGPTSWRADIITGSNGADSYREFLLEFGDFSLAYRNVDEFDDGSAVNAPGRKEIGLPHIVAVAPDCPGGAPRPCPEAVSAEEPGTMTVNYRNEPLALRIRDPRTNTQAPGLAGDLSFAYQSRTDRADPRFNVQPTFYPPLTAGVMPGDPFTPLLRAYENDKVQIRILVGAQEEGHNFKIHGQKWLSDPSASDSGYVSSQLMGISEHFEFNLASVRPVDAPFVDYLVQPGASTDDQWNGLWTLLRAYSGSQARRSDLLTLPNNPKGDSPKADSKNFTGVCPRTAPQRKFSIVAAMARDVLPDRTLVYNANPANGGILHDPTAILFVHKEDLDQNGLIKAGVPVEPLILRANAGDCIFLEVNNRLPEEMPSVSDPSTWGYFTLPMIVEYFNANDITPSNHVGLTPQLLLYDQVEDSGDNAGFNAPKTAPPGGSVSYKWYAGDVQYQKGSWKARPMEYGAVNLMPSDPIKHAGRGAVAALIVEPQGARWEEDPGTRASATVTKPDGSYFREFVLVMQNSVNLQNDHGPVPNLDDAEDPEDSGQKAFNYRTEPLWKRTGLQPDTSLSRTRNFDFTNVLSSRVHGDPQTPVFHARPGEPVRFRFLHGGGNQRNNVFQIHGHGWDMSPYTNNSSVQGKNGWSNWTGSQAGIGPFTKLDLLLTWGAGGAFAQPGDYLYRDQSSFTFDGGLWAIFRVGSGSDDGSSGSGGSGGNKPGKKK